MHSRPRFTLRIGVCSYLLIGFWFHRLSATKSAQKAMLVNRVSDTLLIFGLILQWWYLGGLDYSIMITNTTVSYYNDWICLTLLLGAMGKSAQLGLHVWLADAMEGPTPVSALIHAATLVTAGVYLIVRTSPLWECSEMTRSALTILGAMTSLVAATCGLFQNDLKRVIAYSTCSQRGYMMVSCGLNHSALAMYHLMTHACFKALLFRSAGVVIHAVSDVQDRRRLGGIQSRLPLAWSAMILGSLSLVGWPFLSGFYSKDQILELCWSTQSSIGLYAYFMLMIVACMTSYYSFRLLWCTFVTRTSARRTEIAQIGVPMQMSIPLIVLSIGSVFVGYILNDMLTGVGTDFWHNSLQTAPGTGEWISMHFLPSFVAWLPLLSVFTGFMLSISYAWPFPWFTESLSKKIYLFLLSRWQFDIVYNQQIARRVLDFGADTWKTLDKGLLELLGPKGVSISLMDYIIPSVRQTQTGAVHDYALVFLILALSGLAFIVMPVFFMPELLINNVVPRFIAILSLLYFFVI
jgi:NADH-ubiquinone oxidoreductase chain 5